MIVDEDNPSPLMQQYVWEQKDAAKFTANGPCRRCKSRSRSWGWCPECHPLHYAELPR
jgi:hypothetical protein